MTLAWFHEHPARWDRTKANILGAAPKGVFDFSGYGPGDLLPGEWWRAEESGAVVGFGWMDATWGDAEILLAVDPAKQTSGVGTFILDRLEGEARARGLNHLYNVVPAAHPDPEGLRRFLEKRRFTPSEDGRVLRRVVRAQ